MNADKTPKDNKNRISLQKKTLIVFLQSIDFPTENLPELTNALSESWKKSRKTMFGQISYDNAMEQFVSLLEDLQMNSNNTREEE